MAVDAVRLQKILDDAVNSGEECGLQLTVYQNGKLAAELCSGFTDSSREKKVTCDTLFPIFSSGKAVMATAFHMLKEEVGFDYSEKVSRYWKEYGCNGKEDTEILHILSHRSGVHVTPQVGNTSDLLADWDLMCGMIANAVPAWVPGTKCGYQSISFAWLLGELAYRISDIPFKEYITRRILEPLGVADKFFFGIPSGYEAQMADIDATAFPAGEPVFTSEFHGNPKLRHGFIPSANGIATAGAAAKIFNNLYHDMKLLAPETIENATILSRHPDDPVTVAWTKFGLGYVLPVWETSGGDIFGHGGAAGAELLYCKSLDMALCFVKNRAIPEHPYHPVRDKIADVLGLPHIIW